MSFGSLQEALTAALHAPVVLHGMKRRIRASNAHKPATVSMYFLIPAKRPEAASGSADPVLGSERALVWRGTQELLYKSNPEYETLLHSIGQRAVAVVHN